jgi:hypothetical protein
MNTLRHCVLIAILSGYAFHSTQSRAQEIELPGFVEVLPTMEGAQVIVTAIGSSLPSDGPLAASRLAARRRGEARARQLIHRWADDALAAAQATPSEAQATHTAIDRSCVVVATRPLADGSATLRVACPLAALRAAFDSPRVPWHGARS